MTNSGSDKNIKSSWPAMVIFLVGMHSILLGLTIYFFTDFFYNFFFAASLENPFFVRQSGTFLFLAGLFYLYPLLNLKSYHNLILLVVFSKIVAVYFLIANATSTTAQMMIYLAAFFDGLMAIVLVGVYFRIKVNINRANKKILNKQEAGIKEIA